MIHLETILCDKTFFPQKGEILTNLGLLLAFKAVDIFLGGICMPNLKKHTWNHKVNVRKVGKLNNIKPHWFLVSPVKF